MSDQELIKETMADVTDLLLRKNRDYGSSFRKPGIVSGIMSVETAQEKFGLDKKKNRPATADWNYGPPMTAGATEFDAICDECEFFDDKNNWCEALDMETGFDARTCGSFRRRLKNGEK